MEPTNISEIKNIEITNIDDGKTDSKPDEYQLTDFNKKVRQYITLLHPVDTELINFEYIYTTGHNFINLYKDQYLPYLEELKTVTKKYYNSKKYSVESNNKSVTVLSAVDGTQVKVLNKPKVKNVRKYIAQARNTIQRNRNKLMLKYNELLKSNETTQGQVAAFNKKKESFVEKLNEYYAVDYYFNRINVYNNLYELSVKKSFNGKMFYKAGSIKSEKKEVEIENTILLREKYVDAMNDIKGLGRDYITEKMTQQKNSLSMKSKREIDVIIIEKEKIIEPKFFFNNNDN